MYDKTDLLSVNAVRTLSIDQINKANSGHPGLPMGAAPMAYALWTRHMKQNPANAQWPDRDRFVLSAGHGSALLYSLLHLAGYDVTIDDLKNFRQFGSRTPGHPEVHHTDGVEATTGPLGQGFVNGVGMAMAEAHLAATYNKEGYDVVDHYTYVLCGDGDLMEGISSEASSLAGHLKLGKLIVLYDSNDISLDGPTSMSFTENVKQRYEAYGWQHLLVKDGEDLEAISKAIEEAQANLDQPTIIEIKTIIGIGSPNQGTNKVHGNPLGAEGAAVAKKFYGWEYPEFAVPEEVKARFEETVQKTGEEAEGQWNELFAKYKEAHPELAKQFEDAFAHRLPEGWEQSLPTYALEDGAKASRSTSQEMIQAIAKVVPHFWGGSADLASSNNTMIKDGGDFLPGSYEGRNIWYGVREFAMGAIMNGIVLHGGTSTFGGTFFVFSDYVRPAVRVAALSNLPVTYVFTHDSIAVGEDGPTHEPVEQLASWRAMPGLDTIRPADGNEVRAAWRLALEATDRPTMLVLSRQNLPVLKGDPDEAYEGVKRGGYVISPAKGEAEGILISAGSEVYLAMEAQKQLAEEGIDVSVVSIPSFARFEEQDAAYKESVLPKNLRNRLSVEMSATYGWGRYVGLDGVTIGLDRFGASGNGNVVTKELGFTAENVVSQYKEAFHK